MAHVRRDRRANLRGEGKDGSLIAFASGTHLSGVPVNIVELEKGHFT